MEVATEASEGFTYIFTFIMLTEISSWKNSCDSKLCMYIVSSTIDVFAYRPENDNKYSIQHNVNNFAVLIFNPTARKTLLTSGKQLSPKKL